MNMHVMILTFQRNLEMYEFYCNIHGTYRYQCLVQAD